MNIGLTRSEREILKAWKEFRKDEKKKREEEEKRKREEELRQNDLREIRERLEALERLIGEQNSSWNLKIKKKIKWPVQRLAVEKKMVDEEREGTMQGTPMKLNGEAQG